MDFSNLLIQWYLENKRELPWRNTTNPYHIWLSEIMLQQTRVAQATPYFFRFIEAFPSVIDLANADEEKILKLWQGLGYYSRARNLHKTAQMIVNEYQSNFPKTYKQLLELKGIGEYTAGAIASFAYNEQVPVVDGNVYRVLSRYFDIETNIASSAAKKEFILLAKELIPNGRANIFNQAIMEFGAIQCVPKNPACNQCVLNNGCLALKSKKVSQLPVKIKNKKIVVKHLNYLIFIDENNNTIISKRIQKGIWQNLHEFPVIETHDNDNVDFFDTNIIQKFIDNDIMSIEKMSQKEILHKLSHQHLFITFWKIEVQGVLKNGISIEDVKKLSTPIVIHNFLDKNW